MLLADNEIAALAEKNQMIEPFVSRTVSEVNGQKILSYGLGSYGYDIRLDDKHCFLFGGIQRGVCDPKDFDTDILKSLDAPASATGLPFLAGGTRLAAE